MKQIGLLIATAIFMLMINIDYTAVNLALVTISQEMHSDLNVIQWLLSGYALAWAAMMVPAGKLADIAGRKRSAIVGLILFILGSIITGAANSSVLMIVGRVLQGMAGAIAIPTIYGFIYASFPREKIGMALGVLSLGIGLGMALGPTFGGVVLTYFGWRWIFYINVPLGLIILALILWSTKEAIASPDERLDKLGACLLSGFIVTLLYAIGQVHRWGAGSLLFIGIIVLALTLLTLFIWRQVAVRQPLIPLSIFDNRHFVGSSVTLAIEQFVFSSVVVAVALYLQQIAGFSPLDSSLIFLALSLMTGLISPCGGYMVGKFGFKQPAVLAMVLIIVGLFWTAFLSTTSSLVIIIPPLVIIGIGMGIALTSLQTGIITTVPEQQVGVATGVFIMLALIGNSLGVLITTLVYEVGSTAKLIKLLTDAGQTLNLTQKNALQQLITHIDSTHHSLTTFTTSMQTEISKLLPIALSTGFSLAMIINIILMLVAMIFFSSVVKEKYACQTRLFSLNTN